MSTSTLERPPTGSAVRFTELALAVAFQYALSRVLARAVGVATRVETEELAGTARR